MSHAGSSVIFDLLPTQAMSLLPAIAIFGALLLPKTVASACLLSAGFSPFLDGFRAYLDHAAYDGIANQSSVEVLPSRRSGGGALMPIHQWHSVVLSVLQRIATITYAI